MICSATARLAKAYRFLADPRDSRLEEILEGVDKQEGLWGCNTVFQCVKICPKEVPPTYAIQKLRAKILRYRFLSLFVRNSSLRHKIKPK